MSATESDDEWVVDDHEASQIANGVSHVHAASMGVVNGAQCLTHDEHEDLPSDIVLHNFLQDGKNSTVYRCEPVAKEYPSIGLPDRLKKCDKLLISMVLFHPGCEHVQVRLPDFKDKIKCTRSENGVCIDAAQAGKHSGRIRLKKKAHCKSTGKETAFCLGANYLFHTNNIEPQFVIIATPVVGGRFDMENAARTRPFFVKSKRQDRYLPKSTKKRKKDVEVCKINTDIHAAKLQCEKLNEQFKHYQCENRAIGELFARHMREIEKIENDTVRISLQHAFRPMAINEVVEM